MKKRMRLGHFLSIDYMIVPKKTYFKRLEALDYIARYDVKRGPDHAAHLKSVAKKALERK